MKHALSPAAALVASLLLAACSPDNKPNAKADPAPDFDRLCETKVWVPAMVKTSCKPGQKVAFLPDSWGNQQLPIYFAALNCDLRYQVVQTPGGVTCIFRPATVADDTPTDESKNEGEGQAPKTDKP